MPQLTKELWDQLWKAQNEREAAERERLKQAVAAAAFPPSSVGLWQVTA